MTTAESAALPYRPCVGMLLLNREGLAFVGRRIDQTAEAWQMPQGGIDAADDDEWATALRELEEETGIPPRLAERLFEPFVSSKSSDGTGLGLTISRELAALHGGDLRLVAGEGGATFELRLPD